MRISDWSSDVCSSDLLSTTADQFLVDLEQREREATGIATLKVGYNRVHGYYLEISKAHVAKAPTHYTRRQTLTGAERSEEHTSELQSLMRISYAVFCLKKKNNK